MKNIIPFLAIIFLLTACGDDDDATSNTDLTELAVGVYHINGNQEDGTITVNKKNNNTVTISVQDNYSELEYNYSFTDVVLSSETTFELSESLYDGTSEYTIEDGSSTFEVQCNTNYIYNGDGTVSSNSISLFINVTTSPREPGACPSGNSIYNLNRNVAISGTRQ